MKGLSKPLPSAEFEDNDGKVGSESNRKTLIKTVIAIECHSSKIKNLDIFCFPTPIAILHPSLPCSFFSLLICINCINGFLCLLALVGICQWRPLQQIKGKEKCKVKYQISWLLSQWAACICWPVTVHFRKFIQITHLDVPSVSKQDLTDALWEHIGRNLMRNLERLHRESGTWAGSSKMSRSSWGDGGEVQCAWHTGQMNKRRRNWDKYWSGLRRGWCFL